MTSPITLLPLSPEYHVDALQAVYRATPGYWQMYNLPSSPAGQAARDLQAATETPGRYLLGIVQRLVADDPTAGAELIGLVDLRLDWPAEQVATLGLIMVAEPYQRRGVGAQTWRLLRPWLADTARMARARLAVEQFNTGALHFFTRLGFALTGEARRIEVGGKFVRLLTMELDLTRGDGAEATNATT
jgi:RimJ/RimL family protein N-acetyltransferase